MREQLRALSPTVLVATCARLRPTVDLADPEQDVKTALRRLARRHQHLTEEIRDADADLGPLVTAAGPRLLPLQGVGIDVAPIPAGSGRSTGIGSTAVATVRPTTPCTPSCYADCATTFAPPSTSPSAPKDALGRKEIIRCLKRYIAREIYTALQPVPAAPENLVVAA